MFRVIYIFTILMLSACTGGISGTMSSSAFGYWQVYKVEYSPSLFKSDYSVDNTIEDLFYNLAFESNADWHSPMLSYSRINTFKRPYKDRYIRIDVELSDENIILMSMSYSPVTENIFKNIESELNDLFGESNVAQCYGVKDVNGFSCFRGNKPGVELTKIFSDIFGRSSNH